MTDQSTIDLIDETEASQILGVARDTLRYWRWQRSGPAYIKLGRTVRYTRPDLAAFVRSRTVSPQQREATL